jgi:peptide deformylase
MIKPIIIYGDPILRERSNEVPTHSSLDLPGLISDMFETMHKANGVGLSAIQIGIPLRIFVIEAHLEEENFHFRGVFINPKITKEWGEIVKHPEGCLSIPLLTAIVDRPENIELEWYDEEWKFHKEEFSGIKARIIQHEYDHLEGELYIDNLDTMWSKMIERPLQEIEDQNLEIPYLWKK